MPHLLLIGAGGFFGAVARYVVDGLVAERTAGTFPWGTLVVNLSGSFALGLLATLAIERSVLPAEIRGPLLIGFLGAYTTFSTLTLETLRLAETGTWLAVAANLGLSVGLGMVAVVAGVVLGRAI
jgi:CrcB protein